ncbi:MAG: hypothetical protein HY763_12125 [Planctomycetes bacterium]|nr:hypothetical protein [Planctomycetota bacterium]
MYDQSTGELVKLILAAATALVAAVGAVRPTALRAPLRRILWFLTLAAVANYFRLDPHEVFGRINGYDCLHYYMGSKYYDELGYWELYPALLAADDEDQRYFTRIGIREYRDHATQILVSVDQAKAAGTEIRARFTAERWKAFQHDVRCFAVLIPVPEWRILFGDRGYNATPVARLFHACISNRVPVEGLRYVTVLDTLALAAAVLAVRWAVGTVPALFAVLFLTTSFSGRWPPYGQSLLRMDWIAAATMALCLLKRGYPVLGGVVWGYAACIRVFPLVCLFGMVVRAAGWIRREPSAAPPAKFVAACLLAAAALCEVVLLRDGVQPFQDSWRKLATHQRSVNLSSQRVGLGIALAYRGELREADSHSGRRWTAKKRLAEELKPYRYGLAAAVAYLVWVLARRRDDCEALLLGIPLFFFAAIVSYYYYIMRLLLVVLHSSHLERASHRVGLALLFLLEVLSQWHQQLDTSRYAATAQLSVALALYFLLFLALNLRELYLRRPPPAPQTLRTDDNPPGRTLAEGPSTP